MSSEPFTVDFVKQGNGTVTANKPGPYPVGTQVQLTAVPDAGWHFVRWESTEPLGDQVNQPTITITVSKDVTYTAHFEPDIMQKKVYLPLINR